MNTYETRELLDQYLLFHFGSAEEQLPWHFGPREALSFPVRCADLVHQATLPPGARALDVGCAVGRASWEMARSCEEVVGVDFSANFVRVAEDLRQTGATAYRLHEGGRCYRDAVARPPRGIDGARIRFLVGDAQDLPAELGAFDVVLAANLICRLPEPRRFLARLPDLVRPYGQLVITTPHTWLEAFTPAEAWLDAAPDGNTLDALQAELPDFTLEEVVDLPFLIREHARKYQWSVAQASRWRRR